MPFITTLPASFVTVTADTPVLNTNAQSLLNSAIGDVEQTSFIRGDNADTVASSGETLTIGVGEDELVGEYVGSATFSNVNPTLGIPGLTAVNVQLNPIEGHVVRVGGTNYFVSDTDPTPDNILVTLSVNVAGQVVSATIPASEGLGGLATALRTRASELPGLENTATRLALNTLAGTVDTVAPATGALANNLTINVAPGDEILDIAPVCFTRGTLIETPEGPRPIETLAPGDPVLTRDHGPQPVRWIGRRVVMPLALALNPHLRPIRIRAGALGCGMPTADLVVSPQHRVLVRSAIARKMFGTDEILVAAKHLLPVDGIDVCKGGDGIDVCSIAEGEVEYIHLLFDRHEIVMANGAQSESLLPGREALRVVGPDALAEILTIFPELAAEDHADAVAPAHGIRPQSARPLSSGRMGRKLAVRHVQNAKALVDPA